MPTSEKQRAAADKWDKDNMTYQTIKVRKETLQAFKDKCKERGEKVNTVLREYMEAYARQD